MKKELLERLEKAETEIMAIIDQYKTEDDMTELKVEIGCQYLEQKYGYDKARIIWKSKTFWAWWKIIWHMNNCDIIDFLSIEVDRGNTITWEQYGEAQLTKSLHKYKLTAKELREIETQITMQDAELVTT